MTESDKQKLVTLKAALRDKPQTLRGKIILWSYSLALSALALSIAAYAVFFVIHKIVEWFGG